MESNITVHLLPSDYADLRIHILFLRRELDEKKRREREQTKTLIFLQKQNTELHQEIINRDKQISILLNN
jgi:hypothetical protein